MTDETKKDSVAQVLEEVKPLVGNVTFGTLMGYCSGTAMKKVGRLLSVVVGVAFISLQVAASFGFIQVDWNKINVGFVSKADATGDGKIDVEDAKIYWKRLKELLTKRVPAAGGFSFGFLYGVRYG
jgi:uncharacterized membrane protein (Fun14 family)